MPVNLPKLNRLERAPRAKADRLNFQVKDQGALIQRNVSNLSNVVDQGLQVYQDVEDNKITQLSNEAENEYSQWNADQLNKLRAIKGDPTDAYQAYEKAEKEKVQEMQNSRPDLNDRVQRHVNSNFGKVQDTQRISVLKQKGLQQNTYENNLFESTLKLQKNDLPVNAGFIRKEEPATFFPFDQKIQTMKDTIVKRGLRDGTARKLDKNAKSWGHQYHNGDEWVKVQVDPIAQQRIAKEVNEGVFNSINVMINSGYPEEAKMVMDKYSKSLDGRSRAILLKKFDVDKTTQTAHANLEQLKGKTPEQQTNHLEGLAEGPVKDEMLKIKASNDNRIEDMRERSSKANYNELANHMIAKMNSNQPFYGQADLEADPKYKETWDKITDPKQKKAILESLEPPKNTKVGSEIGIQDLFFGNNPDFQVETMSPSEFATFTVGLNKKDKSRYTGMFNKLRVESAGEQRATHKRAGQFAVNALLKHEEIEKDKFGKYDEDDTITIIDAQNALMDHLADQKGVFSDKELRVFVDEYVASTIDKKPFVPTRSNFRKGIVEKLELTPRERSNFKVEFKREKGYIPKANSREFVNFVKESRRDR